MWTSVADGQYGADTSYPASIETDDAVNWEPGDMVIISAKTVAPYGYKSGNGTNDPDRGWDRDHVEFVPLYMNNGENPNLPEEEQEESEKSNLYDLDILKEEWTSPLSSRGANNEYDGWLNPGTDRYLSGCEIATIETDSERRQ